MEFPEGDFDFDFEEHLNAVNDNPLTTNVGNRVVAQQPRRQQQQQSQVQSKYFRPPKNHEKRIVCWKWIENLCPFDKNNCPFLHELDSSKMPICRFYLRDGDCPNGTACMFKHEREEEKVCFMYESGFCPNGPYCRYKHNKHPGPPPTVKEVVEELVRAKLELEQEHRGAANFGRRKPTQFQQQFRHNNQPPPQKPQKSGEELVRASILPEGSVRYFIVKSNNYENIKLSRERGEWATLDKNVASLNKAYDSCDHVMLFFSVTSTRNFQGCALMKSKIGEIKGSGPWTNGYGGYRQFAGNFKVQWLKHCKLSFDKVAHLKNIRNGNHPVWFARDCQEVDPVVGEQVAALLCEEPDV